MPEYREWMLSFPSEYLLGLLRLSLMIPFMTLCFLKSVCHPHPSSHHVADYVGSIVWRYERTAPGCIFLCIHRRSSSPGHRCFSFVSTKIHCWTCFVFDFAHHCAHPLPCHRYQHRNPHTVQSANSSGQEPVGRIHPTTDCLLHWSRCISSARPCSGASHHYFDRHRVSPT
jgi:hypothetical protein